MANGLRVWQQLAGDDVELVIEDHGSDPEQLAERSGVAAGFGEHIPKSGIG